MNDLQALQLEAADAGQYHVSDACARLRACLAIGAALDADSCSVVQTYIGKRTGQNRYGR